jgi:hypothetical protein
MYNTWDEFFKEYNTYPTPTTLTTYLSIHMEEEAMERESCE